MSRPSHVVPDYVVNGKVYHHDRVGTVHDGPERLCESCRLMTLRYARTSAQAYAETVKSIEAVAAKPRMSQSEVTTVRAVNVLLRRKKPAAWPWILGGGACALGIWALAVYGAVALISGWH